MFTQAANLSWTRASAILPASSNELVVIETNKYS
jgi:hypothetical protein